MIGAQAGRVYGEVVRMAQRRLGGTVLLALLAFGSASALTLVTSSARGQLNVVEQALSSAQGRTITIQAGGVPLTSLGVQTLRRLSTVERVVPRTTPVDATAIELVGAANVVPTWWTDDQGLTELLPGTDNAPAPVPGALVAGRPALDRLGLDSTFGVVALSDGTAVAVREYRLSPFWTAVAGTSSGLIGVRAEDPFAGWSSIHVLLRDTASALQLEQLVVEMVAADPTTTTVRGPIELADLRTSLLDSSKQRALETLQVAALALMGSCGLAVHTELLINRAVIGRRRALGASRGDTISVELLRVGTVVLAGATAGLASSTLVTTFGIGPPPTALEGIATLALFTFTALGAAVIPVGLAATRDPVLVLRRP